MTKRKPVNSQLNQEDQPQRVQESQYSFPYHYIPEQRPGKFSGVRYWSWGYRYLGGIKLVLDLLAKENFTSLADIGCGDGRFLREVARCYSDKQLLGVDVSEQALRFARAFNPGIEFLAVDITAATLPRQFDVATLIEVMEHIPPTQLDGFVRAVAKSLHKNGRLLVTVPHLNKPLIKKHYQHFNVKNLLAALDPYFTDFTVIPFDVSESRAAPVRIIEGVLGSRGKWLLLMNQRLLYMFYQWYLKRYLYARDESQCERLAVICSLR